MWKLKKAWYRTSQFFTGVGTNFVPIRLPEVISGENSVAKLPELIKKKGITRVLVVTDSMLMKLRLLEPMLAAMSERGITYALFDEVKSNPTIDSVEAARAMYIENKCEALVAFGGGSPMDCAKAAAARVVRPNKPVGKMRGQFKILHRLPPLFAVPTTAGTGSEATLAAVISDAKTHEKYALNDPSLVPHYAVLDPLLTVGLPKQITATTGLDALTHAVEAYTNRYHSKLTVDMAEEAVRLIFANLENAYNDGHNMEARKNMLRASYCAGVAFTRDMVGNVHAIAHTFGGMYGTPHGLANSVILPVMLEYFGERAYGRLAKLADVAGITTSGMSDKDKARAFIDAIKGMNERMGIPKAFPEIREEDIELLAKRATHEANQLYPVPRIMSMDDCKAIIHGLMEKREQA